MNAEFTDEDFAGLQLVADRALEKDAEEYGNWIELSPSQLLGENANPWLKGAVDMGAYFIPGVGEALALNDAARNYADMVSDFKRGKWLSALGNLGSGALNTAFGIPIIGTAGRAIKGGIVGARTAMRAGQAARAATRAGRAVQTGKSMAKGFYNGAKGGIRESAALGLAATGARFDHAANTQINNARTALETAQTKLQNLVTSGAAPEAIAAARNEVAAAKNGLGNLTRNGAPIVSSIPGVRNILPQRWQKGTLRNQMQTNQKMINAGMEGVPGAATGVPTFRQTFGTGGTWRTANQTAHQTNPFSIGLVPFLGGQLAFSYGTGKGDLNYMNKLYQGFDDADKIMYAQPRATEYVPWSTGSRTPSWGSSDEDLRNWYETEYPSGN